MCGLCGDQLHQVDWLGGLTPFNDQASGQTGGPLFATGASTVAATGNTDVNGLLGGFRWNSVSVDYNFPSLSSYYAAPYGLATGSNGVTTADLSTGFVAVSETFKTMVRHAFADISAVSGLVFNEVGAAAASNISIGRTTQLGSATPMGFGGYGYGPGAAPIAGDIWFANSTTDVGDSFILGRGTYTLVLHELGHALGLKHGHTAGGVANTTMTAAHDFNDYSIMSYRRQAGGATSGLSSEAFGRPQTLMMYDILALQTMYGANFLTNSGNTTYSFSTTTGQMFTDGVGGDIPGNGAANSNRIYRTLWDGGGVDTYDFSNYATNLLVDLTPGGRSTLDINQLAVVNSTTGGRATGNLFNALQFNGNAASLIENATGGSGADTITGNVAANQIIGNLGNDTIDSGAGNDTLYGGSGGDTLIAREGDDLVYGDADNDIIDSGADNDTVYGGAGNDLLYAYLGNDVVYGQDGNDFVYGDGGNDILTGDAGNDDVRGATGDDVIYGGLGDDYYFGGDGSDQLFLMDAGIITNAFDAVLDFQDSDLGGLVNDYIVLPEAARIARIIFDQGGYTWIASWDPAAPVGLHYNAIVGTNATAVLNNLLYV